MNATNLVSRFVGATAFALPIAFANPIATLAQSAPTFNLRNNTSVTLREFYVSPTSSDDWEEDILGTRTLPAGSSILVTIDDGRSTCFYDILGVFADGEQVEDYDVDICDLPSTGYQYYEN